MRRRVNINRLSIIGLLLLGVLAAGVSLAALQRFRPNPDQIALPNPAASQSVLEDERTTESSSPTPTESPTPSPTPQKPQRVVVIGDSHSLGDTSETWIGYAAGQLDWGDITNLSSPGRGYSVNPRSCDFQPCVNFLDSVPLVIEETPDIVITFGGTADGGRDVKAKAKRYFGTLRNELPDAKLVALSPITTSAEFPEWLRTKSPDIQSAVESVDGIFIDLDEIGLGDGDDLSPESHKEIAQLVVNRLSDLEPVS